MLDGQVIHFGVPPLVGDFVALNTPAQMIPSHGTDLLGQRFAYDLVYVTPRENNKPSNRDLYIKNSLVKHFLIGVSADSFRSWSQEVVSPLSGRVVSVQDGQNDRLRVWALWEILRSLFVRIPPGEDLRSIIGNSLILETTSGFLFFAHFKRGSIRVKAGELVTTGQVVGLIGNSGNSTMPHLHIHLMDREDLQTAAGVPLGFLDLLAVDDLGNWEKMNEVVLKPFQRYRNSPRDD